ncbi:MAG: hypothetical protein ACRDY7_18330, partial [Acidimicrobiia bacterium]
MGFGLSSSDPLRDALDVLTEERGLAAELSERTIRLRDAVKGDPRLAALRVLGVAQTASPVGAAAFGPEGVAAAVWSAPELYLVGWTATNRWLVGYRLTGGAGPNDYVRSEGRIPSHLEIGNWYQDAPEEASAAFAGVGLSLGTPPFPLPEAPPPPPAATRDPQLSPPARRTRSSPAAPSPGRT